MKLSQAPIRFWRSREQPPAPGPGPVPPPAPEPAPPAPDPQPPTPEPTPPAPELRAVPAPEPEPEPAADPGRPAVARIPPNGAPREWNVWDLERLARDGEAREGELAFLLLELRQFANAEGQLPMSFDPVVRESFGELLYAAV